MTRTVLIDDNAQLDPTAELRFTAWVETTDTPDGNWGWANVSADSLDAMVVELTRYVATSTGGYLEAIGPDGVRAVVPFPSDPTAPPFSLHHRYVNGKLVFVRDPISYWTFNVIA